MTCQGILAYCAGPGELPETLPQGLSLMLESSLDDCPGANHAEWNDTAGWRVIARSHTNSVLQAQYSVPTPSPIVDANSRFAFKLFKQLTTKLRPQHPCCPTGLSLTFGLLDNGSDPETRKELNRLSNSPHGSHGDQRWLRRSAEEMNLILRPQNKVQKERRPRRG